MTDFPGIDALEARVSELRSEVEALEQRRDDLATGLPPDLEARIAALETATPEQSNIVQVPNEGWFFDALKGFFHFLSLNNRKNEGAFYAKDQDAAALRLGASHSILGKLVGDLLRPSGVGDEKVQIQFRLGKVQENSGELVVFLNDGRGVEDDNLKEALVLGFDNDGNIGLWIGDDPRSNQINYPQFPIPDVPAGIAPLPQGSPGPPEPDRPLPDGTTHIDNLINPPDEHGWWSPRDAGSNARLIQEVELPGNSGVIVEVYLTDQSGTANLRVDIGRVTVLDRGVNAGVNEYGFSVTPAGPTEVDIRVTAGTSSCLIRNVRTVG